MLDSKGHHASTQGHHGNEVYTTQVRPAPRVLEIREDACYLIVGGLKGLCGSLAIELAKQGAKHLAVISRSGYDNESSEFILHHVYSLGCHVNLLIGDISVYEDVRRALSQTTVPVKGIIHGAMVLLVRVPEFISILSC